MALEPKYICSRPPIDVADRSVKRYYVANTAADEGGGIAPLVEDAALAMLPTLLPEWDGHTPRGSWMILHEGRDGAAYVNAYSWVWDNVVEVHSAAAAQPHVGCPDDDPTNFVVLDRPWVGCIWELPPFGHERSAWVRHVFGADDPDLAAYLADSMPGGLAGPSN